MDDTLPHSTTSECSLCLALESQELNTTTSNSVLTDSTRHTKNSPKLISRFLTYEPCDETSASHKRNESGLLDPSEESSTGSVDGEDDLSCSASLRKHESQNTSQDEDGFVTYRSTPDDHKNSTSLEGPKIAQTIYKSEIVDKLAKQHFENDFFEVRRSPLAGLGAFAKQDLHEGDIILKEGPLFTSNCHDLFGEFEKLDGSTKAIALGLAQNENLKTGTPALQAVMWTNSFSTKINGSESGLFAIAARVNHACRHANNVEFHYDRKIGCLVLTVVAETVEAGSEITICYGPNRSPLRLWDQYGFQCRCGACPGISDEELRAIELREFFE